MFGDPASFLLDLKKKFSKGGYLNLPVLALLGLGNVRPPTWMREYGRVLELLEWSRNSGSRAVIMGAEP